MLGRPKSPTWRIDTLDRLVRARTMSEANRPPGVVGLTRSSSSSNAEALPACAPTRSLAGGVRGDGGGGCLAPPTPPAHTVHTQCTHCALMHINKQLKKKHIVERRLNLNGS